MTLNIDIKKSDVYAEVIKVTGYTAKKALAGDEDTDSVVYERIASNELNEELFDRYFDEASAMILKEARYFLKKFPLYEKSSEAGLYLELDMPTSWDSSHKDGINTTMKNYYVEHIVSKWMRLVKHEDEQKYAADEINELNSVRYELNHRRSLNRNFFGLNN